MELDDIAEGSHEVLPLAILSAFLEARRLTVAANPFPPRSISAGEVPRTSRVLRQFCLIFAEINHTYYNEIRTHTALGKDAPCTRPIERFGDIIAYPILGGLHHRYARI
jgi:hypothetical protein